MKKFIISIFIALGLLLNVGCNKLNISSTNDEEIKQIEEEVSEEIEKDYIIPHSGSEQDIKEKEVTKNEEIIKEESKKDWHCPVCGSTYCPKDSECLNPPKDPSYTCDICHQTGTCTEMTCYNYVPPSCGYCNDTGVLPGGTICDACHCRGCGELIENCYCGAGWNVVYCPQCGAPLGPNGTSEKCSDCGYGY